MTNINEKIFKQNPDVIVRIIEGEAVLLDLKSGVYFGLDDTGTEIWDFLKNPANIKDIACHLEGIFSATSDEILENIIPFIKDLLSQNLILDGNDA